MKNYVANAYLIHNGVIVKPCENLKLTDKQVERLGEKVSPVKEAPKKEEKPKKETTDKKETK